MQVKDIMTKDVIIVDINDTVLDVAKLMAHHNIGCVPVTKDGQKVLGMITDRDIVLAMARYNRDPENTLATNIMTTNVYSVKPDAELGQALALMKKQQIRRLPVMENEILLGMISLGDFAVYTSNVESEISEALTEISKPARAENI